jgi:hypothetical protein
MASRHGRVMDVIHQTRAGLVGEETTPPGTPGGEGHVKRLIAQPATHSLRWPWVQQACNVCLMQVKPHSDTRAPSIGGAMV